MPACRGASTEQQRVYCPASAWPSPSRCHRPLRPCPSRPHLRLYTSCGTRAAFFIAIATVPAFAWSADLSDFSLPDGPAARRSSPPAAGAVCFARLPAASPLLFSLPSTRPDDDRRADRPDSEEHGGRPHQPGLAVRPRKVLTP